MISPVTRPAQSDQQFVLVIQGHNPAPQGSKRYVGHRYSTRAGKEVPYLKEDSPRVDIWRKTVAVLATPAKARHRMVEPMEGVLEAYMIFVMKPKGNAVGEKDRFPVTHPYGDLDKLQRATFDALTAARVIHDDARIARVEAMKVFPGFFSELPQPGAYIRLRHLRPDALEL